MNPGFYNTTEDFLYSGGDPASQTMDCLQLRQPAGPFHYLINEQAKSLVALQELQHEVGALLEFRDLVIETFPNLRSKLTNSTPATMMMTTSTNPSHIPLSIRTPSDWTPGVRVRKKLVEKTTPKKLGEVQDSGFSTEASSKETHSASAPAEDELWNLLDVIHRKGTRLRDEVEAQLRDESDFQRVLFADRDDEDIRELRQERDLLLERLAEMEAEVLASRVHTSRLQEDLENLLSAKHDLEEQLKAAVTQRGEVNSCIRDLHSQFVTKSESDGVVNEKVLLATSQNCGLDTVLGDRIPTVTVPDSQKIGAILRENNVMVLKKHLLCSTVQNQALQHKLETTSHHENVLTDKLDKAREENEELRFQLEDKSIQLEGTRARVRLLEQHQKHQHSLVLSSPDVVPELLPQRTEISTASMKAMSPILIDHTSSTESAHNESSTLRSRRPRPSRIPLKSYTAPKPPSSSVSSLATSKRTSPARSRSGDAHSLGNSARKWASNGGGKEIASTTTAAGADKVRPKSTSSFWNFFKLHNTTGQT